MHLRKDIKLTTGKIFRHYPLPNGAQALIRLDSLDDDMTEAEWQEYCQRQAETRYSNE